MHTNSASPIQPPTAVKGIFSTLLFGGSLLLASQLAMAGQAPVPLATAGTFAILAGAQVTSADSSTIIGDIGCGSGYTVGGFPPGTDSGTIHQGDPTASQAEADLSTAYNNAAGRANPVTLAGNIGGTTLPPGLYMSTSSLAVSSGDLTLDAGGDSTAVWIFQIASTLTTTTSRQVILSGGAQANNVFWQVGSSATIGNYSTVEGTIMAYQAITIGTGATLTGRALAENGEVTMDGDTVTDPTPEPGPPSFGPISVARSGAVTLIITNTPGRALTIQFSTDLKNWTILANPTPNESPYTFVDNTDTGDIARYYRAYYP